MYVWSLPVKRERREKKLSEKKDLKNVSADASDERKANS
jgi:hypothetical protein